jgi:hypothetical protein
MVIFVALNDLQADLAAQNNKSSNLLKWATYINLVGWLTSYVIYRAPVATEELATVAHYPAVPSLQPPFNHVTTTI